MRYVYFSDCYKSDHTSHELASRLENCLQQYKLLKGRFGEAIDGILTEKPGEETLLSSVPVTLAEVILLLPKDLRTYAYKLFIKFPITETLVVPPDLEDNVVMYDYILSVGGSDHPAMYLKMVHDLGCIIMSLNTHEDLARDQLEVFCRELESSDMVDNLYGDQENTNRLITSMNATIAEELPNYERLLFEIGEHVVEDRFQKQFLALPTVIQERIIIRVSMAKNRGLPSHFDGDNELIKDLPAPLANGGHLKELRIFQPKAIRLYFAVVDEVVYLASVVDKPSKKSQSGDINAAAGTVNRMQAGMV